MVQIEGWIEVRTGGPMPPEGDGQNSHPIDEIFQASPHAERLQEDDNVLLFEEVHVRDGANVAAPQSPSHR